MPTLIDALHITDIAVLALIVPSMVYFVALFVRRALAMRRAVVTEPADVSLLVLYGSILLMLMGALAWLVSWVTPPPLSLLVAILASVFTFVGAATISVLALERKVSRGVREVRGDPDERQ